MRSALGAEEEEEEEGGEEGGGEEEEEEEEKGGSLDFRNFEQIFLGQFFILSQLMSELACLGGSRRNPSISNPTPNWPPDLSAMVSFGKGWGDFRGWVGSPLGLDLHFF